MTLLVVYLAGAADGLSILVPNDPIYRAARPTLALTDTRVSAINARFGINRAAPGLLNQWNARRLAFIPAVGYPNQNRSHFNSRVIMETGGGPDANDTNGWIARHLNSTTAGALRPFRGLTVGSPAVPRAMTGSSEVVATEALSDFRLGTLAMTQPTNKVFPTAAVTTSPAAPPVEAIPAGWKPTSGPGTSATRLAAAALNQVRTTPPPAVDVTRFGTDPEVAGPFAAAAQALSTSYGTELMMLTVRQWDTHGNQNNANSPYFDRHLGSLDAGITGVLNHAKAIGKPLTILVMSEFGRRVAENNSGGTDHGKGGLAMLIGDRVNPGIKGVWPGLANLDDGDVPVANNLRAIQHEVVAKVLRNPNPGAVISGITSANWLNVIV